jgi:hypothetical protein
MTDHSKGLFFFSVNSGNAPENSGEELFETFQVTAMAYSIVFVALMQIQLQSRSVAFWMKGARSNNIMKRRTKTHTDNFLSRYDASINTK